MGLQRVKQFLMTLRGFVFAAIVGVTLLVFLGVTLAASLLYENILSRQAETVSESVAQQTFNSMFQSCAGVGPEMSCKPLPRMLRPPLLTVPMC